MLAEVLQRCGVPRGVVNIVHGLGASTGSALVSHSKVRAVSFTGGTVTARKIIEATAGGVKKLSLELGGKNPGIVFADADLQAAAAGTVRSSFTNQGEICLCTSRILVQRSAMDAFLELFVPLVRALKVGDPRDPETKVGALVSQEHLAKIERYVAIGRADGGEVLAGGCRPADLPEPLRGGYYYTPTVIRGVSHSSACCQEEIFGPVVVVVPFEDEAEALRLANDVPYGLAATLWTQDVKRAHRIAQRIMAGTVWVNTWMPRDLRMPFGGMKASGVGREGGEDSLEFFTERRTIAIGL